MCIYKTKDGDNIWDEDEWTCGLGQLVMEGEFGTESQSLDYTGLYTFSGKYDDTYRPIFNKDNGVSMRYNEVPKRWEIVDEKLQNGDIRQGSKNNIIHEYCSLLIYFWKCVTNIK